MGVIMANTYRYTINENNLIEIFKDNEETPFIHQPQPPIEVVLENGLPLIKDGAVVFKPKRPWADAAEAIAWAENFINND